MPRTAEQLLRSGVISSEALEKQAPTPVSEVSTGQQQQEPMEDWEREWWKGNWNDTWEKVLNYGKGQTFQTLDDARKAVPDGYESIETPRLIFIRPLSYGALTS